MAWLRWAPATCAVVVLCCSASCGDDDDDGGSVATHGKDGGGRGGRGGGAGGSGADRDGGSSASGGRGGSGGSVAGSGAAARDGGSADADVTASDPSKCAGVSCPAPSLCDREATPPTCVCPPGYEFTDLGDDQSPCQPDCNVADCDGGS